MKVGAVLAGMAGVLRATCERSAEEAKGVKSEKEANLRHLGSELCSLEKLRKWLEFKFENRDILEVWEIMQRKGVCARIVGEGLGSSDKKLDGYPAMLGMMLTDGRLYERYLKAFEKSRLDVTGDEGMIRTLMKEMVTGDIWEETREKLALMASKRLEEIRYNRGEAREEDETPSAVYHIASLVKGALLSEAREWSGALAKLLRKDGLMEEIVKGKYNEELIRIMDEGKGLLGTTLCDHILMERDLFNDLVYRNKGLGKEIIANAIEQGHWLCKNTLRNLMKTKAARKLLGEHDVFEKIRRRYGVEGELSMEKLLEQAKEGRLDGLIETVVERMLMYASYGEYIGRLKGGMVETVGEGVLAGFLKSKRSDGVLKEGMKRSIRDGNVYFLERLPGIFKARLDELTRNGVLDGVLKEEVKRSIINGRIYSLGELAVIFKARFDELTRNGELDGVLKEGMKRSIRDGNVYFLERFAVIFKARFDELTRNGELDGVLKEEVKRSIRDDNVYFLERLPGIFKARFDELTRNGVLDGVLKEEVKRSIRDDNVYFLERLAEIFKARFDELTRNGEFDGVLKE